MAWAAVMRPVLFACPIKAKRTGMPSMANQNVWLSILAQKRKNLKLFSDFYL